MSVMSRLRLVGPPPDGPAPPPETDHERAVQRYQRAVDRFHEKTVAIPDRALRLELARLGGILDSCLSDLQLARRRGALPGREEIVINASRRTATLCAHATEVALMAGDRARHKELDDVVRCVDTCTTLVKAIRELADTCLLYAQPQPADL